MPMMELVGREVFGRAAGAGEVLVGFTGGAVMVVGGPMVREGTEVELGRGGGGLEPDIGIPVGPRPGK